MNDDTDDHRRAAPLAKIHLIEKSTLGAGNHQQRTMSWWDRWTS